MNYTAGLVGGQIRGGMKNPVPREPKWSETVVQTATQQPYRWVMLALATLAYFCFGLVRQIMATLVNPITQDLRISYTQMGTILGAWPVVYIGVALTAGLAMDKVGLRKALGIGILFIALSAILRAFANSFETMLLFVAIFGLGAPTISVGGPKLISLWFEGKERGVAASIFTTGLSVGSIVTLVTANSILMPLTASWRWTSAIYGLVVLIAVGLWLVLARERQGVSQALASESHDRDHSISSSSVSLLKVANVWVVVLIGFVGFLTSHGITDWLPKILQTKGMSDARAGFLASIPGLAGIVGTLTIPGITPVGFRRVVAALLFMSTGVSVLLIGITSGPLLLFALVLLGLGRYPVNAMMMLILMDTPQVGAVYMGAAAGLYFSIGEIGGFVGPFMLGYLLDLTGGFLAGILVLAALNVALMAMTRLITESRV